MASAKNTRAKTTLHPRNRNRAPYNFTALIQSVPELAGYVSRNKFGDDSIDFSNPIAVKLLNKALLAHHYGINKWDFPDGNLCPPIPGRADYIHYVADLLSNSNAGTLPTGRQITCFDIGVGASCIYPIIGVTEYHWKFIGSDISRASVDSANRIVRANPSLQGHIECRLQKNPHHFFQGIIKKNERIDVCMCNPPFHSSVSEAERGTRRKIKNLTGKKDPTPVLNFGGKHNELVYEGGEFGFIQNMIKESREFAKSCFWFTTLVSKKEHLPGLQKALQNSSVQQIHLLPMGTGNKTSRLLAWTFLSADEQQQWRESRWQE